MTTLPLAMVMALPISKLEQGELEPRWPHGKCMNTWLYCLKRNQIASIMSTELYGCIRGLPHRVDVYSGLGFKAFEPSASIEIRLRCQEHQAKVAGEHHVKSTMRCQESTMHVKSTMHVRLGLGAPCQENYVSAVEACITQSIASVALCRHEGIIVQARVQRNQIARNMSRELC